MLTRLAVFTFIVLLLPRPLNVAAQTAPQKPASVVSTVDEIQEDLQNVPCRTKDRQDGVRALFLKMGAEPDALAIERLSGVENLVIRRQGSPAETIVIGAHYDFVDRGCGAVDNWSGIVALAHVYRTIRRLPSQKTIVFVAFGREEEGLLGSKAMVRAIPKDRVSDYCAMVNIDSFGLAKPFAMENTSSSSLMTLAKSAAESLGIPFYTVPIRAGDADSSSFLERNIPAITLSGLSNEWQTILHTPKDQATKVIPLSVYLGYRLALAMWSKIDEQPCAAYRRGSDKTPSLRR